MSKKPVCMSCGAEAQPGWSNLVPVAKGAYLCRGCVEATLGYFEARGSPSAAPVQTAVPTDIPTPGDLLRTLDRAVVGQQAAKQLLAVAAWKHLQRNAGNTAAPRAHVLLYGPTGCGKTHLARTMAALMDVPFVAEDATTFSEAGYKGRDVREILADVLDAAEGNVARAQHAVVFVDEFDKLSARGSEARAVYQHGTQHGFLTLLEGGTASADRGRSAVTLDTSNLLFVFAGAFSGMEEVISERLGCERTRQIGFGRSGTAAELPNTGARLKDALPEDFVRYGLEGELVGRIPVLAPILPLTALELKRILLEPEHSVCARYSRFFGAMGRGFSVEPAAAELLAAEAYKSGSGARGLRGRLERIVTGLLLAGVDDVHITADLLREEGDGHGLVADRGA